MKRDLDLVRQILLEVEQQPYDSNDIVIEGYSEEEIAYHIKILKEAGLVEAINLSSNKGLSWKAKSLTWAGHEFLDASRNETIWSKAKEYIVEKGLSSSFEVIYKVLIKIASSEL